MVRVKDRLNTLNVRPQKSRGQNFVIDPFVLQQIISFGAPKADEKLVEIGPGLGALTGELYKVSELSVVEIEGAFCNELQSKFPALKVFREDARSFDFSKIGNDLTVFGNLPYSFSTDIVMHLIESAAVLKRAVLMLQKEFVERLAAAPGGKTYGSISIACQIDADISEGPVISGSSFHPPTEVESKLVEFRFLKSPRYPVQDRKFLRRLVRAVFSARRKKISNGLKSLGLEGDLKEILLASGIDPDRRPETLSVEEFVKLSNKAFIS